MKERFFYLVGIIYFIFSLISLKFAGKFSTFLGIFLFVMSPIVILFLPVKYKRICKIIFTTATVAVNVFNARFFLSFLPAKLLAGHTGYIYGTVQDLKTNGANSICLINAIVKEKNAPLRKIKLLLYNNKNNQVPELSDEIEGKVKFFVPENKNGINYEILNKVKGILLCAKPAKGTHLHLKTNKKSFIKLIKSINSSIKNNITSTFSDPQRAIINGLLLGDKSAIPNEIKDTFKKAGIYHTLVVSGLHMSIITHVIFSLFLKL